MTTVKRFFLSFFLTTGSVSAQDTHITARQALMNMNSAMQVLNYQGTVAFFRNNKLETMKYFHAVNNGQEQERLLSLNSPLREIVRYAGKVSCRFNDNRPMVVDHRPYEQSFIIDLPSNFDLLANGYQLELEGEEEIAMLPSYVINIKANDEYRYDRKVWIEKQKFLPLKVAIFDPSGEPLEQVVFTEHQVKDRLSFVDISLPFADDSDSQSSRSPDQVAFVMTQLPPGFKAIYFTRRPLHQPDHLVDHLVLSDGFATISVYMESANTAISKELRSAGAVNSYSQTVDNDYLITVIGEVPAITVKMIAEGVKLKSSNHD